MLTGRCQQFGDSLVFAFAFFRSRSLSPLAHLLSRFLSCRAEVFCLQMGALLGKMSCQDAKLEIEDSDAYYVLHAPPLGV